MKGQMYRAHSPLNSIDRAHCARALRKVPVLVRRQSVQGKVPLRGTNGLGLSDLNSRSEPWADGAGHSGPGCDRGGEERKLGL